MITGIERITIDVPNIQEAIEEFKVIHRDLLKLNNMSSIVSLSNITLELKLNPSCLKSRISSITFLDDSANFKSEPILPSPRGIKMHRTAKRHLTGKPESDNKITGIDQIVIVSSDLDSCVNAFGTKGLGIRLALDQVKPEWGGRMLFFRTGKVTLEIIENHASDLEKDLLWGFTYLSSDIRKTLAILEIRGVKFSKIRRGRKNGTLVATLKSHNLGLPTLFLQKE